MQLYSLIWKHYINIRCSLCDSVEDEFITTLVLICELLVHTYVCDHLEVESHFCKLCGKSVASVTRALQSTGLFALMATGCTFSPNEAFVVSQDW